MNAHAMKTMLYNPIAAIKLFTNSHLKKGRLATIVSMNRIVHSFIFMKYLFEYLNENMKS